MAGNHETIVEYLNATGVPYRITSTVRHNSITSAGHLSCHDAANMRCSAVDFAGPSWGRDTPELYAIFCAFEPVEHLLHELIYAGPEITYNVKRGQRVTPYAQSGHHDHVHVAVANTVTLPIPEDDMTPEQAKQLNYLFTTFSQRYDDGDGNSEPLGWLIANTLKELDNRVERIEKKLG